MVSMFLVVLGVVGGFLLCLVARELLKGCEARRIAAVVREEENYNANASSDVCRGGRTSWTARRDA